MRESSHRIVIDIPSDVYFELQKKAGPLPVRRYIELLLRNIAVRDVTLGGLKRATEYFKCLGCDEWYEMTDPRQKTCSVKCRKRKQRAVLQQGAL